MARGYHRGIVRGWIQPLWRVVLFLTVALALGAPQVASAAPASGSPPGVPPELAPWIEWVKEVKLPAGDCREHEGATICVWPSRLALRLDAEGGEFELEATAFHREPVSLPGDDTAWPQQVRVDGKPAVVRDRGEGPRVELTPGRHRVTGRLAWPELPDTLTVPPEIALIDLRLRGTPVAIPLRDEDLLTLEIPGEPEPEPEPEPEDPDEPAVDSERVEVSRWLRDGVPLSVTTQIDLHVSGKPRALTLPYPLWDDAELLRVDSGLPLRLGQERELIVQARPGSYTITLEAALPRPPESLGPPELAAPWPKDEVWVWRAATPGQAAIGQVVVSGGLAVDRGRTHAPESWEGGATFRVQSTSPLLFEILQRGVSESAPNELRLYREMRPALRGGGWAARDEITGTLHQSTRMDLRAGDLASAIVNDRPQVVTVNREGVTGVELRDASIRLRGTWRSEQLSRALPLGGWSESFDRVELRFWLPRGWDVLRVDGPGSTRETWIESWRPLDLLALLGVCVLIGRLLAPWLGGVALLGLGLAYTSRGDGFLMLLALMATLAGLVALLRREHSNVWLRRGLRLAWAFAAALLAMWILWRAPEHVVDVWRGRESVFDPYSLERELTALFGFTTLLGVCAGLLAGVGWLIGHARVRGRVVLLPAAGALALLLLAMLFTRTGGDAPMKDARQIVTTAAPIEKATALRSEEEPEEEEEADDEAGGQGQRHKGEEGRMGKPTSKQKSGLYAMRGAKEDNDESVWGSLSGEDVGEAYGVDGLGLSGTGRGGGGTGEGVIGLGNTGLIGKGGGDAGSGYGRGSGAGFGGRGKRVPRVRQGTAKVQGALDRDIIRRVVRAHINEVRHCYNQGLSRDPNLQGRVAIKFVITATGKIGSSVTEESTVKDNAVNTCVAKAVKRWKFPKPRGGGNVLVSYPFTLSGDGGAPAGAPQRFVQEGELPKPPPSAVPQTGEGMPDWPGQSWSIQVDRSVAPDETVRLWLIPPYLSKALSLLRALALALLSLVLLLRGWRARPADSGAPAGSGGAAAAALLLTLALPGVAYAAPPSELLEQLKARVEAEAPLAPSPECQPDCAMVSRLELRAAKDTLTLRAEIHMAGPGVYRLPGSFESWIPRTVRVDQRPAGELVARDGALLVRLAEGVHTVELSGPVGREELNLDLARAPKRVELDAEGWAIEGVDEYGRADSLYLRRQDDDADDDAGAEPAEDDAGGDAGAEPGESLPPQDVASQELPTWLAVHRVIEIGPRWTARTTITRLNHGPAPVKAQIPLLPGEKLLEATGKIDEPRATVSLERAGSSITWSSVLEPGEQLALEAPVGSPWTETWTVTCGSAWQCGIEGAPATRRDGGTSVYHPWPGESLTLSLFKPAPAEGELLAVDRATLRTRFADTGSEASLVMQVRTATVTTRTLRLPEGARLGALKLAGLDVPMAKDATELRLTFQPGVHELRVEWKHDDGLAWITRTPSVSLGGVAVELRSTIEFTDDSDRVILASAGDSAGPFVWIWLWVGALALLAVLLGRGRVAPLKEWQWLLLGLGFHFAALPIVFGWFIALHARERVMKQLTRDGWYNALQLLLILWTLAVAIGALITCQQLLTGSVSTHLSNWASYGEPLTWYADRTSEMTPTGWALTIPESLWRGVWALWVIWLAWQSLSWARWAWATVSSGGWFRVPPPPPAPPAPSTAEPEPPADAGESDEASSP